MRTPFLFLLILSMLSSAPLANAQVVPDSIANLFETKPQAQFLKDSVQVGELVPYTLYFDYPKDFQVIFPDSSYHFFPFEYSSKDYYHTHTQNGTSRDSVVYYLSTFELETRQSLSLPVFVLYQGDTIPYFSDKKSIILDEIIKGKVDKLHVKVQNNLLPFSSIFNYPLWIALGVVTVVIIIVLIILFGGSVIRSIKAYRLKKIHNRFLKSFEVSFDKAKKNPSVQHIEDSLHLWKMYLQKLESQPFSSYTTKEIGHVIPNKELINALKTIDMTLYASKISDLNADFEVLKNVSNEFYNKKREQCLSKKK